MYTKEIFYSVRNGGDGSAYPAFMESKELVEWDQDHMHEGWGESCTGSITVSSDSPITVDEIITKEDYLLNLLGGSDESLVEDFVEEFFPEGYEATCEKGDEHFANVTINGEKFPRTWAYNYEEFKEKLFKFANKES